MYNVFLLDDALEDLKSQKKKIVSKTSRKNGCYGPLTLLYARYLHILDQHLVSGRKI